MYDLENLSLRQMTECGAALRGLHRGAGSMEDVCERIVRHLHTELHAGGEPACMLVRAYKTHSADDLEPELRTFAAELAGHALDDGTKCLTLMASAGDIADWNSRHTSRGHRAIPLVSASAVARLPMVAQLVRQLGLDVELLIETDPAMILDMQQRTFNVFYVPEAVGSPHIPAQAEFVERYGVRSVLGFGSVLPTGDLFAVILFSRASIPAGTARQFESLALAAKLAVLPFAAGPVFRTQHD